MLEGLNYVGGIVKPFIQCQEYKKKMFPSGMPARIWNCVVGTGHAWLSPRLEKKIHFTVNMLDCCLVLWIVWCPVWKISIHYTGSPPKLMRKLSASLFRVCAGLHQTQCTRNCAKLFVSTLETCFVNLFQLLRILLSFLGTWAEVNFFTPGFHPKLISNTFFMPKFIHSYT